MRFFTKETNGLFVDWESPVREKEVYPSTTFAFGITRGTYVGIGSDPPSPIEERGDDIFMN